MSAYHSQFVYFVDEVGYMTEFINGARTGFNLSRITNQAGARFGNADVQAGCRALRYRPSKIAVTPPSTITCESWELLDYSQAAMPWYADWGIAPPGTAYGLYATDITGLDGAHYSRDSVPLASRRGGASYGPLRNDARVCKFNCLLLGATEIDLEHMFRWVEQSLASCCGTGGNEGGGMVFRRYCPDLTGYDDGALANEALTTGILTSGLTMARGAVLLEGPTWESPPTENSGCYLRAISFTIGFADPCLYVVDETQGTQTAVDLTAGTFTTRLNALYPAGDTPLPLQARPDAWSALAAMPAYPIQVVRTRADYIGTASAVVTVWSNAEPYIGSWKMLPDLRIVTYLPISNNNSTDPGLAHRVAEVVLAGVPSGQIVEVDMHRQTVRETGSWDTREWSDASGYLRRVVGAPRWAGTNCNGAFIRVEPASVDQTKTLQTAGTLASGYQVKVLPGTHFGCSC